MGKLYFCEEAELFAHKAWATLKLEPPADLSKVAERLGIAVHEREFVEQIDGFYLRIPGAPPVVAVNNSYLKPPVRRRFTIAHEIGHHLLARRVSPDRRLFFFDTEKTRRTVVENACDRFAALLLMPDNLMRRFYDELSHNSGQRVRIMAERFGVSTWALRRRLSEMDLPVRKWRR